MSPHDHPFDEVVAAASAAIARGYVVFQKFTCVACGSRQTMDVPDTFWTSGSCEECGAVTDIKVHGCNYLAVGATTPEAKATLAKVFDSFSADSPR